jgi:two-component system chemotaxis sensor kinase CheA
MKFGIARKLSAVCLAFGLPIVVMLVLMTKAKLAEIDFAEKEVAGDRFQRPLEETLQHVARHRRLWLRHRHGESSLREPLAAEANAVATALRHVEAADRQHGTLLEFTPAGLGLRKRSAFTAQELRAKWERLVSELHLTSDVDADRAYRGIINHLRTMITHAGDCSNLILDPDLDSYYLMDVTLLALPQMEDRLQQVAVDVDRLALGRKLDMNDKIELAKSAGFLEEADWDRIEASASTALNEDANFHGSSATLAPVTRHHLRLGAAATQAVVERLRSLTQAESMAPIDLDGFRSDLDRLETELYSFHRDAFDQEDILIGLRTHDFQRSLQQGFALAGLSVLASALLAFLLASNIVRRLLRISATTDAFARGDMAARVGNAGGDEIGDLAVSFDGLASRVGSLTGNLERLVDERTRELSQRNREFALILDNAHDGMLTVDLFGKLSQERSAIVETWFGAPAKGATLAEYLARDNGTLASMIDLGLGELRDDILPREVVLAQLPQLMQRGGRHFGLSYSPIVENETLTRLLVIIADISAEIESRHATALQQETLRIFQACQADRAGFLDFFMEARELVERVCAGGRRPSLELRRAVHTLKGNCGLTGLLTLSELCHRLESDMDETGGVIPERGIEQLRRTWDELSATVMQLVGEDARRKLEIGDEEYAAIIEAIAAGAPRVEILGAIAQWKLEPASRRLGRLAEQARALAQRLRKSVEVKVEASHVRLCADDWAPFWGTLVHAIRNAVDHGLEASDERALQGKPGVGTISLRASTARGRLSIEVSDDGRGIAWDRVAARASALNLPHGSRAELVEALFADGLSTREAVNETSGRGVGMSAIRETCHSLGGRIEVESEPGEGTTIRFSFPESAMGGIAFSATASRPIQASRVPGPA